MKVKLTVGLIIVFGALGLFLLSNTGNSKPVYYYSPTQFNQNPALRNDRVRLKGTIEPGTVKQSKDKIDLWFDVTDGKAHIPVHYRGAVPDAFQEGLQVVVDGRMGGRGTFQADELIVKCPSKYESRSTGPRAKGPTA